MIKNQLLNPKVETADAETNLFYDPDGPLINFPPAIRSQADNQQDYWSLAAGTDLSDEEDMTKQEFKEETDINNILNRYMQQQQQRPMAFGEYDYSIDLQTAIHAVRAAKEAHFDVPDELKQKYPTWREVLNNVENGSYQHDLQNLAQAKKEAADRLAATKQTPEEPPKAP